MSRTKKPYRCELYGDAKVLAGMKIWRKYGKAETIKARTPEQAAWDLACLACGEYLRRLFNGNEKASLMLLDMATPIIEFGETL